MDTKTSTAGDLSALLRTLRPVAETSIVAPGIPAESAPQAASAHEPSAGPSQPVSAGPAHLSQKSGKRSNPSYRLTGVYLPSSVKEQVQRRLIGSDLDLSELVTELLRDWLTRAR
jgi:hypothetical protein